VAPPAAPTPPPVTQNISSKQLEQSEVDKIAAELKQELGASTPSAPSTPAPQPHSMPMTPNDGDTIFIDRDGSFSQAAQKEAK
jgi:hypothetical protein